MSCSRKPDDLAINQIPYRACTLRECYLNLPNNVEASDKGQSRPIRLL